MIYGGSRGIKDARLGGAQVLQIRLGAEPVWERTTVSGSYEPPTVDGSTMTATQFMQINTRGDILEVA